MSFHKQECSWSRLWLSWPHIPHSTPPRPWETSLIKAAEDFWAWITSFNNHISNICIFNLFRSYWFVCLLLLWKMFWKRAIRPAGSTEDDCGFGGLCIAPRLFKPGRLTLDFFLASLCLSLQMGLVFFRGTPLWASCQHLPWCPLLLLSTQVPHCPRPCLTLNTSVAGCTPSWLKKGVFSFTPNLSLRKK